MSTGRGTAFAVELFREQLAFTRGGDVAGFTDELGEVPLTGAGRALFVSRHWLGMIPSIDAMLELVSLPRRIRWPAARDRFKATLLQIFGSSLADGTFTELDDQGAVLSAPASLAFWDDLHDVAVEIDALVTAPSKLEELQEDLTPNLPGLPSGKTIIVGLLLLGLVLVLR